MEFISLKEPCHHLTSVLHASSPHLPHVFIFLTKKKVSLQQTKVLTSFQHSRVNYEVPVTLTSWQSLIVLWPMNTNALVTVSNSVYFLFQNTHIKEYPVILHNMISCLDFFMLCCNSQQHGGQMCYSTMKRKNNFILTFRGFGMHV